MGNWREWDIDQWNAALLDHYFGFSPRHSPLPVVNLLVTADELARLAGASAADAQQVRDGFVKAVLMGLPDGMELFDDGFDSRRPFSRSQLAPPPPFVVHLLFTCLAASESSEQLANERGYRERLNQLAQGRCTGRFNFLPYMWEGLRDWLALPGNRGKYRELQLPADTGHHTLIGYSEQLAFPDRIDQRQLSLLLKAWDLAGTTPLPGPVIGLISKTLAQFRPRFQQAFREFRDAYTSRALPDHELVMHRFWSAIVEASLRGRDDFGRTDVVSELELIVSYDGEEIELHLLSSDETPPLPPDSALLALEETVGDLRFAVVEKATLSPHAPVEALFKGGFRCGQLSRAIAQGFIPLRAVASGRFAVTSGGAELLSARHALSRAEIAAPIMERFRGRPVRCAVQVAGWSLLEELELEPLRGGDADGRLSGIASLQPQLAPRKMYFANGIRSGDGWLGFAEALPRVSLRGADSVEAVQGVVSIPLAQGEFGLWSFPAMDYTGEFHVVARVGGVEVARTALQFVRSPPTEDYKTPVDQHAFYTEGFPGTVTLQQGSMVGDAVDSEDMGVRTGRTILLGPNQGEFVLDEAQAAWKIAFSPRSTMIYAPFSGRAGEIPVSRASHPGLRRKWRELVSRSKLVGADADFAAKLSAVRKSLGSPTDLPTEEFDVSLLPAGQFRRDPPPASDISRLVRAVAGRGCARRGLPMPEWRELLLAFTQLPDRSRADGRCPIDALTRVWQECGLIEVLTSAKWCNRTVFPVKPMLLTHRCGPCFVSVVSGLVLDVTASRVAPTARRFGLEYDEKRSLCRYVPSSPVLSSTDLGALEACAAALGLPLRWVRTDFSILRQSPIESDSPPPPGYDRVFSSKRWSLCGSELASTVDFWKRPDRPAFWAVADSSPTAWSYDKNALRLRACKMAGVSSVETRGAQEILAKHAYLPLPLARHAASLGPLLPGPESLLPGGEGHIYTFATRAFCNEVLELTKS